MVEGSKNSRKRKDTKTASKKRTERRETRQKTKKKHDYRKAYSRSPTGKRTAIPRWWWALPTLFGIIGGAIAWKYNRHKNRSRPRLMLLLGVFTTVLLSAFFISMGGIPQGFMTQYGFSDYSADALCSNSEIELQRAYYDSWSGEMTVHIYNKGAAPLTGFVITSYYSDGSESSRRFRDLLVNPQDIELAVIQTGEGVEKLTVQSMECPDKNDSISSDDIRGV